MMSDYTDVHNSKTNAFVSAMMAAKGQSYARQQGDIAGKLNSEPADFYSLLARIRQAMTEAREARAHAGSIADTIHGSYVEPCGAECARDGRVGLIGEYEDALDELMSALTETRAQLRRISNGIPHAPKTLLG
jgi:hypothetical protein